MLRIFAILLLSTAFTVFSEISLGVDLGYTLNDDVTNNPNSTIDEQKTVSNNFSIVPFVGIYPNRLVEVSPYLGWYLTSSSTETTYNTSTPSSESKKTENSVEPGCGVYFHIIRGEVFDVSLGPKFGYRIYFEPVNSNESGTIDSPYDDYYKANTSIACQFNIDFLFSKKFASRLSTSLFKYNFYTYSYKFKNSSNTVDEHTSNINLKSIFQPTFGLLFTF